MTHEVKRITALLISGMLLSCRGGDSPSGPIAPQPDPPALPTTVATSLGAALTDAQSRILPSLEEIAPLGGFPAAFAAVRADLPTATKAEMTFLLDAATTALNTLKSDSRLTNHPDLAAAEVNLLVVRHRIDH